MGRTLCKIIVDSSLTFDNHVKTICKKASQKLTAISRMSHYLSEKKRKVLIASFFESQFNYCPLVWMFCGRRLNHRINKLHERALRIAYNDYSSDFVELLAKDDTVTIHQRNLRVLAIEMYKISNDLSPLFMKDIMTEICVPYNTRSTTKVEIDDDGNYRCLKKSNFNLPAIKTVSYGFESIRYLGPKIWKLVPDELKGLTSLETFKKKVKSLKFEQCPCNLCRNYVHGVGYINFVFVFVFVSYVLY